MRKIYLLLLAAIIIPAQQSCELINQSTTGLSNDEIINGLKTALTVGTDSSVFSTSKANGYLKDKLIKIALPPEAATMLKTIDYLDQLPLLSSVVDLKGMVNKTEIALNRAAESAATTAGPIFKKSITELSITNALNILQGKATTKSLSSTSSFDSIAATHYLINTTYNSLVASYSKPIDSVLNISIPEVGFTPNAAWSTLVTNYNSVANTAKSLIDKDIFNLIPADQKKLMAQFAPISNVSLGEYVTGKALDGLFLKVGDQEKSIRKDPMKWISKALNDIGDILQKVFGSNN